MAEEKRESLLDRVRAHFAYMRDFFSEYNAQLGEQEKQLPEFTDEEMMIFSGHQDTPHAAQSPANGELPER